MNWDKRNIEKIAIISVATTIMGQIYISPVPGAFRLSMAVAMLSVLLIFFDQVPVLLVSSIVAVMIPFFRAFVHFIAYHDMTFFQTFAYYSPVVIYYILYGIFFELLDIRRKLDSPIMFFLALWLCDCTPNIAEALFRRLDLSSSFNNLMYNIIMMGFARSVFTCILYYVSIYYKGRYDRKQKDIRYREMVLFISSLKSELFFLKKSMTDIEDAMQMSYELYRELADKSLKERVLTISRNVHEIKKDYSRVVIGMDKVLSTENEKSSMSLSEIINIIKENREKIITDGDKEISIDFRYENNFITPDFYHLISVLNNLITNAIDAIESKGEILVEEKSGDEVYLFRVVDNGRGIESDEIDMIFVPGYSTKYDPVTGRMSTGIGLSHVKHIVENHFKGSIHVESSDKGRKTCFEVRIPKDSIEFRG